VGPRQLLLHFSRKKFTLPKPWLLNPHWQGLPEKGVYQTRDIYTITDGKRYMKREKEEGGPEGTRICKEGGWLSPGLWAGRLGGSPEKEKKKKHNKKKIVLKRRILGKRKHAQGGKTFPLRKKTSKIIGCVGALKRAKGNVVQSVR